MVRSLKIGPFLNDDEQQVLRLLSESSLPVEDLTINKLEDFLVARLQDGTVVAAIGLEAYQDVGLLRSLVVHPSHRGKGVGKLLTNELELLAQQQGIKALYLLTTTAADYFPKLGYRVTQRAAVPEPIAETEEFKSVCPVSAVCLYKRLVNA